MKKWFVFLVLLSVLLVSACNNSEELSGQTFTVAYTPVLQEDVDSPNRYDSIMTLEFSGGNVVTNSIYDGEGTYELNDDELVVRFENENENLEIRFTVKESDKDFSEYSAIISDVDFEITDTDKISHFKNLTLKLTKDMSIEFLKK
ncbi:hypothetical protein QGM71_16590 [Virgibacillus sp. C22-A2]|uniref:Lipoprotein n=1 Tax=Virgibacillus tibetensis TaxID=3042313 RepID=A0ABU6KIZ4_9BACI|nr:hypothetical protein [Virgibacillus sp. C22-A2]